MPYIKPEDRVKFNEVLNNLPSFSTKGELEYCIYSMMKQYAVSREFNYSNLHDVIYAAQHCADEFRRHFLDYREDEAEFANGSIAPLLQVEKTDEDPCCSSDGCCCGGDSCCQPEQPKSDVVMTLNCAPCKASFLVP